MREAFAFDVRGGPHEFASQEYLLEVSSRVWASVFSLLGGNHISFLRVLAIHCIRVDNEFCSSKESPLQWRIRTAASQSIATVTYQRSSKETLRSNFSITIARLIVL